MRITGSKSSAVTSNTKEHANQYSLEMTGLGIHLMEGAGQGVSGPLDSGAVGALEEGDGVRRTCLAQEIALGACVKVMLPLKREGERSIPDVEVDLELGDVELVATLDQSAQVCMCLQGNIMP